MSIESTAMDAPRQTGTDDASTAENVITMALVTTGICMLPAVLNVLAGSAYELIESPAGEVDYHMLLTLSVFSIFALAFINNLVSHWMLDRESERPELSQEFANSVIQQIIGTKRDGVFHEMSQDVRRVLDGRVEVRHMMSENPKVVQPECAADEVRELMHRRNAHHLLVCNGDQLIGVISDRDLDKPSAVYASDLMTRNPVSVPPSTLLVPVVSTMITKRISCLPVTEEGRLLGVLTRTDLLIAFQCMLHMTPKLLGDVSKRRCQWRGPFAAE